MKIRSTIVLSALMFDIAQAFADDRQFDWVLEQYKKQFTTGEDTEESDLIVGHASGRIDGDQYLIITTARSSPDKVDGPFILVFNQSKSGKT